MFDNFKERFNKKKVEPQSDEKKVNKNKDEAKERLHLVLLQDRANVSADFLEMMRAEIIDVIKKYVDVNEDEIDVKLANQTKADGTNGAPALYANIPIKSIKSEARKLTNAKVLSGEVKASDNKIADQKVKEALEDDNDTKTTIEDSPIVAGVKEVKEALSEGNSIEEVDKAILEQTGSLKVSDIEDEAKKQKDEKKKNSLKNKIKEEIKTKREKAANKETSRLSKSSKRNKTK